MINKKIVILEATTSGSGMEILKSSLKISKEVYFLFKNINRYGRNNLSNLSSKGIILVNCDTDCPNAIYSAIEERIGTPGAIICLNDNLIQTAGEIASHYKLPFLSSLAIDICRNKEKTLKFAERNGIPSFKSNEVKSLKELIEISHKYIFPIVLKSSIGTGSGEVIYVNSQSELRECWNEIAPKVSEKKGKLLIQEYVKGPLISIETIIARGKSHNLGITDRELGPLPYFAEISYTFPIQIGQENYRKLENYSYKIVDQLKIENGILHTEFILGDNGPVLVEINPRLGGGMLGKMISKALDIDIYEQIAIMSLGKEITIPENPIQTCTTHTIYSDRDGLFNKVEGISDAKKDPNILEISINVKKGEKISKPKNFSGAVGQIFSIGFSAELSRKNNKAAQNCISVLSL